MLNRRDLLVQMAGTAGVVLRPSILGDITPDGLRDIAARRGLVYGCAASTFELRDAEFVPALAREAGMLVAEYEMKRGIIEETRGVYDFSAGDTLLAFARSHRMMLRGHALVWHHKNPSWLEDALSSPLAETLLTEYIAKVAGHFKGWLHSWDVVNEAIAPLDGRPDGLRNTLWLKRFGPEYIDIAYHAARAADPTALLVYNDWGCEMGAPDNDRFRAATLDFLEAARGRGVPIDALGLQGHLAAFGPQVDQKKLAHFLDIIHAMGLKVFITEHDVYDADGPMDIILRDRAVADSSRRFLDVVLNHGATIAVLTWGLSDRFIDPPSLRDQLIGRFPRQLPLDTSYRRKPMWNAMARALSS
jgi:endo-1,4-beta-xylanase